MDQSLDITEVTKALLAVQEHKLIAIARSQNSFLKTKYADLTEVITVCRPVLLEHGLFLTQFPGQIREVGTSVVAGIVNMLVHGATGQYIRELMEITAPEEIIGGKTGGSVVNRAQRYGSALSYARRYAWLSILNIPSDDDDDASRAFEREKSYATRNEPEPERTWQELHNTGDWRKWDAGDSMVIGDYGQQGRGAELRQMIRQNVANGGGNPYLTAATAAMVDSALSTRGLSLTDAAEKVKWTGKTNLYDMEAKDMAALYSAIVTIPKPEEAVEG